MKDNELYWGDVPADELKFTVNNNEVIIIFSKNDKEYGCVYSGRIILSLTTNTQFIEGNIEYHYDTEILNSFYKLKGSFESKEFDYFKGEWLEDGESVPFELFLELNDEELVDNVASKLMVESIQEPLSSGSIAKKSDTIKEKKNNPYRRARKRAVRGDARIKKIQRQIELEYGLPEGSVKLCDRDGKMSPLAKIKTLRDRWE